MGWMPAPLDISIWQSIWTKEKVKLNNRMDHKSALFDFNVGYTTTVLIGLCFILLGAFVMFGSGQTFSNNGSEFANQLIQLYTINLGINVKILIVVYIICYIPSVILHNHFLQLQVFFHQIVHQIFVIC